MAGVTDEECEVELLQDFCWDNGWVVWFGDSVVWIWGLGLAICSICVSIGVVVRMTVDGAIGVTVSSISGTPNRRPIRLAMCSYTFLGRFSSK